MQQKISKTRQEYIDNLKIKEENSQLVGKNIIVYNRRNWISSSIIELSKL